MLDAMIDQNAVCYPAAPGIEATSASEPDPGLVAAMLGALASMARASKRQQAELRTAMHRAGLVLAAAAQMAVLRDLQDAHAIAGPIPLDDGGLLLSVTSAGMERACR